MRLVSIAVLTSLATALGHAAVITSGSFQFGGPIYGSVGATMHLVGNGFELNQSFGPVYWAFKLPVARFPHLLEQVEVRLGLN